jgi:hypothetical protein
MTKKKTDVVEETKEIADAASAEAPKWTARPLKTAQRPRFISLRCIWNTRVIIEPHTMPSGQRYEFEPGQVRGDVERVDVTALLALERKQLPGCCGGVLNPPPLKYFEVA